MSHKKAVYMDFQKAFDTVPHRRLLAKISANGIEGKVLKWIEAFLSNRTQRVVVGGTTSNEADVWNGIHQGSVLGPLLNCDLHQRSTGQVVICG